jgi:hypothetical protein
MKPFVLHITMIAAVLALAGSLPAATVMLKIEPTSSPTVPPGGVVGYQVLCRVSTSDNYGLATVGFDLQTDTAVGQQTVTAGPAMTSFVSPAGFTNPAGFGGEAVDDDVRGIGGAQNTIDNDPSDPANPDTPDGEVIAGIGLPGWVVVATGEIALPTQENTYTVSLTNAFAGVLTAGTGPVWPVAEATVDPQSTSFQVTVSATAPQVFAGLDIDVFEGLEVALHATASDPQSDPLTYAWAQATGLTVDLAGTYTANLTFTAPTVNYVEDVAMSFTISVSDPAAHQASDTVNVRVYIAGDCTLDDYVDVTDLLTLVDAFGTALGDAAYNPLCDFNSDDLVDVVDLLILVDNFGRSLTSQGGSQMMAGGSQGQSQRMAGGLSGDALPEGAAGLSAGYAGGGAIVPGGMSVYEALEYAGLLDIYLDYIAENPEAAGTP